MPNINWPADQDMSYGNPIETWQGQFGDDYTARNAPNVKARIALWKTILAAMNPWLGKPLSILEVGANTGQNLMALRKILPAPILHGIEPNPKALDALRAAGFSASSGTAQDTGYPPNSFDIVFTSGVLIHIPDFPREGFMGTPLFQACKEIVRVSKRWIIAIEYFSAEPREITYQNRLGLLWTRDFGQYYMEQFGLEPVACGFALKALTGLDDLTWWVLRKR